MMMTIHADTPEQRLQELGLTLPAPRQAAGNYVGCVRAGNLLFTAGQGTDEYRGKLGQDVTIDVGYLAARQCIL
ncbi:RidA family protein, partial [Microbacteriaceae bacterium K1510]|nr:RidA family protein [Microbacteriaceae bacterium K1510]